LLSNTGGNILKGEVGEYGNSIINRLSDNLLFNNIPKKITVWMSHTDRVDNIGQNWNILAKSENEIISAI
jgi:GMP synthase (glutamine-hydrolysing)